MSMFGMCLCWFSGHRWRGKGWTSALFDATVPPATPIAHSWECDRCHRTTRTYETREALDARYTGYAKQYGNALVVTAEFGPPYPETSCRHYEPAIGQRAWPEKEPPHEE
mgnify:CR=1 FL=1